MVNSIDRRARPTSETANWKQDEKSRLRYGLVLYHSANAGLLLGVSGASGGTGASARNASSARVLATTVGTRAIVSAIERWKFWLCA